MSSDAENQPVDGEIVKEKHRMGLRLALMDDALEFRDAGDDDTSPVMHGHFAVFDQWTEINSYFEGKFMERIAPGAFKKTFDERSGKIKVLFQHGHDPQIGEKPLGTVEHLREDDQGAAYKVGLFDTGYVNDLLPALRANQLGASFKFQVMREEIDSDPGRSEFNPDGMEERTIKEIRLFEFGPVTFPAYEGATAGLRSITDEYVHRSIAEFAVAYPERMQEFIFGQLAADPERLRSMLNDRQDAPPTKPDPAKGSTSIESDAAGNGRSQILNHNQIEESWRIGKTQTHRA